MIKGKLTYVPPALVYEVEMIKRQKAIQKNAEAMKMLVKYARVGQEVERLSNFNWFGPRPVAPPISSFAPAGRPKKPNILMKRGYAV